MKNKFSLNKIANTGKWVIEYPNCSYTCLLMDWLVSAEAKGIYTDLFDFDNGDALETVIKEKYEKEIYTKEDYTNLRLMLVAMFYEIARRENRDENILPKS